MRQPTYYRLVSLWLYLGVVGLVAAWLTTLRFEMNAILEPRLALLVQGRGELPFQYRMLVPALIGLLQKIPACQWVSLVDWYKALDWLSTVGAVLAFRSFLTAVFAQRTRLASFLSLTLLAVLPWPFLLSRYDAFYYHYDMPALCFFTAGLTALYRRNWKLFYPLFIIGTFNRETTCFLTVIYLATAIGQYPLRVWLGHVSLQATLWVAVKGFLIWLYRDNPGVGLFAAQWQTNLPLLLNPQILLMLSSLWGFTWIPVLLWGHTIPDRFIRRALWAVPLFLLGMGIVGMMAEMRVYSEFLTLILAAFWLIVEARFWQSPGQAAGLPVAASPEGVEPPARWTQPALILGVAGLLLLIGLGAYRSMEAVANRPVAQAVSVLQTSLRQALAEAQAGEQIVIVNYPQHLRAEHWKLMGVPVFQPPYVPVPWLDLPLANLTWIEYRPWLTAASQYLFFNGRSLTEAELLALFQQADRAIVYRETGQRMYTLFTVLPTAAEACQAQFAGVCLVSASVAEVGSDLRLDLTWRVTAAPLPTTVFVHVFDASGALVAQADGDPRYNTLAFSAWPGPDYVLNETRWASHPSGVYTVRIGLYLRDSGQRLAPVCARTDECGSDGLLVRSSR